MQRKVDLHLHSHFSDGVLSPAQIVTEAARMGLAGIAITDHDSVEGLPEAIEEARKYKLDFVPGIELSAQSHGRDIHILGYFIDWESPDLRSKLVEFKEKRRKRAKKIVENLNEQGVGIDFEEVIKIAGPGALGRLHIARALQKRRLVSDVREAFEKFIGEHCPAYVPKNFLTVPEAVSMIEKVNGIPVLAHPYTLGDDDLIMEFVSQGIRGIEAWHRDQGTDLVKRYERMAQEMGLFVVGGSDCHGMTSGRMLMGTLDVPHSVLDNLCKVHEAMLKERGVHR